MRKRFSVSELEEMCKLVGITLSQLRNALRSVGPKALRKNLRESWTPENPTRGFCYRVCEAVDRCGKLPSGFSLMRGTDGNGSHYFFQREDGEILDLTAEQCTEGYDYSKAKPRNFLPQVSKGAEMVAKALGWELKTEIKLKKIHKDIHSCNICNLDKEKVLRKTLVQDKQKKWINIGKKALQSEIFIVAQSLAQNQVRLSGIPYHDSNLRMSKGGRYLEKYLNSVGYTLNPWDDTKKYVYTTDLVKCFPGRKRGGGDKTPSQKEIKNCFHWFRDELSLIKPKVILLLGAPSTKAFFKMVLGKEVKATESLYRKRDSNGHSSVFVLPHPISMVKEKSSIFEDTFNLVKVSLKIRGRC